MVSLKSFCTISPSRPAVPLSEAEKQIQAGKGIWRCGEY
jgi:hypothetical protein